MPLRKCMCLCHNIIVGASHGSCPHPGHNHPPGESGVCHLELFLSSHLRCRHHHKLATAYWSGAIPWRRLSWLSASSLMADAFPRHATCLPGDVVALEVRTGLCVILQGPMMWPLASSLTADASPEHATCCQGVLLPWRSGPNYGSLFEAP